VLAECVSKMTSVFPNTLRYLWSGTPCPLTKKGKPLPGVAQVAIQQRHYVGKLIFRRVSGKSEPAPFSYFDKGNLAVVGKGFAVLESGKLRMSGYLAWLVWAVVHLQFLATSSLRWSVFLQWVWTYSTGQRGAQLIVIPRDLECDKPNSETPPRAAAGGK
jgi:NADH dehydrogenase